MEQGIMAFYNTFTGATSAVEQIRGVELPDPWQHWDETTKKAPCPEGLPVDDNRFRVLVHLVCPEWLDENLIDVQRYDADQRFYYLSDQDRAAVDSVLNFYDEDTFEDVKWDNVPTLASILIGVEQNRDTPLIFNVKWNSLLGRLIRKNKIM